MRELNQAYKQALSKRACFICARKSLTAGLSAVQLL